MPFSTKWIKKTGLLLLRMVSLLFAACAGAFLLVSLSPVDPVQQYLLGAGNVPEQQRLEIARYWGLDTPPLQRFANWISGLFHGDMGTSFLYRQPVWDVIKERFPATLALMLTAWVFSGIFGILLGCIMGMYRGRRPDKIIKKMCLVLASTPAFWLGLLLLLVFSVKLGWFPVGFRSPVGVAAGDVTLSQRLHHLFLPALTLSLVGMPATALHTRQKLTEVLESDYVFFAKARGESTASILWNHGLRGAVLPALTLQFASLAELFGGSVLAETVFSYPGLGSAVAAAGLGGDVPLLLGITLISALFVFVGNAAADLLYAVVDPRIREGEPNWK